VVKIKKNLLIFHGTTPLKKIIAITRTLLLVGRGLPVWPIFNDSTPPPCF